MTTYVRKGSVTVLIACASLFMHAATAHAQFGSTAYIKQLLAANQTSTSTNCSGFLRIIPGACPDTHADTGSQAPNIATSNQTGNDVTWNSPVYGRVCNPPSCGIYGLSQLKAQVSYHVRVTDNDTGRVYTSGDTVPQGTHVKFEFVLHQYADIYWLSLGYNADSPYGDWIVGAGQPTGDICIAKNYVPMDGRTEAHQGKTYAVFSVDPPAKTISGVPSNCIVDADGVSRICTLDNAGMISATFNFTATIGKFYGGGGLLKPGSCMGPSQLSLDGKTQIDVSTESIPFTLNVIPTNTSNSVPAAPSVNSNGSCIPGTPHSLIMTSIDPNNDQIKYGIDWNADGSVDEWAPPTGFVPSGTAQIASRTYSTEGTKTVKVLAQDVNGLSSGWGSVSFNCTAPAQQNNTTNNGNGSSGNSGFNGNNNQNNASGNTNPSAVLRLSVPSLVARGRTVQVTWSADNVTNCQPVHGDNGDTFQQVRQSQTSFASPISGDTSAPITTRTIYTLTCTDLNGQQQIKIATVNIQPNFREK